MTSLIHELYCLLLIYIWPWYQGGRYLLGEAPERTRFWLATTVLRTWRGLTGQLPPVSTSIKLMNVNLTLFIFFRTGKPYTEVLVLLHYKSTDTLGRRLNVL